MENQDPKFNTFKKYKFNHGEDTEGEKMKVTETLGLGEDFAEQVLKTMRIAEIENERWASAWEDVFNKILPQNAMEAFYIGWVAAKMYEKNRPNPFAMLASLLRDK